MDASEQQQTLLSTVSVNLRRVSEVVKQFAIHSFITEMCSAQLVYPGNDFPLKVSVDTRAHV